MINGTPYLLVADDNPDVRNMVAAGVRMMGWQCETAETPKQIIDIVTRHALPNDPANSDFDALICDINYKNQEPDEQERTGVSAIRELRKQFPNLPVIFITAHPNTKRLRDEALSVAQEMIAKPFDVTYLLDRARVWMSWSRPNTQFPGESDRRRFGINRTGYHRRATDKLIVKDNTLTNINSNGTMRKAV